MTQNSDESAARIDEDDLSSGERGALDDAVSGGAADPVGGDQGDGVNPPGADPDAGPEAEEAERDNQLPGR
jgi:hypothetical protein